MNERFTSDGYELALCYFGRVKCTMDGMWIGLVMMVMNGRYDIWAKYDVSCMCVMEGRCSGCVG